jgi:hypothetical protein
LLIVVILGEIAEGGGDFTVVSDLLVDSVTIGCALVGKLKATAIRTTQIVTMICIINP